MGEAKQRKRLFNNDFDLIDKSKPLDEDNPNYIANKSPFLFLIALEAMLRTFVKAGSNLVEDPEASNKMVLNVDREPVEEHLANVRSFILTWYLKTKRPKRRQDHPTGGAVGHEHSQEMVAVLPRLPRR